MKSVHSQSTESRVPLWFSLATRLLFSSLLLLLSAYCLLAYLPDTFFAYIQAPYQRWLIFLIRFQPWIYSTVTVLLGTALLLERREGTPRRAALEFLVLLGGGAILFFAVRPFAHIANNSMSYIWSLVLLVPVLLLAVLDHTAFWKARQELDQRPQVRLEFAPVMLVACAIGIAYPGMGFLRALQMGEAFHFHAVDMQAWLAAIGAHMMFCAFLVSLFNLPEALAQNSKRAPKLRFLLYNLLAWLVLDRIFQNVILNTLPFYSVASQIYSALMALALVLFGSSLRFQIRRHRAKAAVHDDSRENRLIPGALAFVLLASTYVVPAMIGVVDWNFLLEKLWSLSLWTAAIVIVLLWRPLRPAQPYRLGLLVTIALCTPLVYLFAFRHSTEQSQSSSALQTIDDALARHSYFDASYQAIRDLWSWRQEKSCDDLCQYLLTQSNLPPTARASAVEIGLTQKLTPVSGAKPNIFIFVVDSLRPDYLSPYNPAANFTPEIAKFASESTVMHNAFTRYAGTTLSEPAIWAGAMLLHKHYIQPFHKVNSLERMLDTDGYQKFISVDTVLQVLLKRTPDLVPLDEGVKTWTGEDMCSTVDDAEAKIGQLRDPARPVFMFAQPQNVHGITIASLGPERAPKRPYPGFVAKTASEVERLDGCFGRFVRYLKTSGLYANSIVVLTSDHGDSFGEFGHKGHALELNLSVLRVPLIIHLPDNMRNRYYNDPKQVAFNTDITATLYYLVGHLPIVNDARFGRPLFTATAEEAATYRRSEYLVASSYGPVYGILGNNGKSLFVANAVDGTNAYYDLEKDPGAVTNRIDEKLLVSNQKRVREYVQQIADLYQFQYRATTFSEWLIK